MVEREDKSLATLISDLAQQVTSLLQTEGKLLRAELSEKAAKAGAGALEVAGGAICLLAALIILLEALVIALAKTGIGPGWSSLLVGIVVAVLGVVLLRTGAASMNPSNLAPERTQEQLKRDTRVVKEQLKMTDKTSAELELDAEAARARVASTADSIRNKMSPGQLIDEFSGLFTGSDSASLLSNLKSQVRDNPLPLSLVGVGLAWLMMGQGSAREPQSNGSSGRTMSYPSERDDRGYEVSPRDRWTSAEGWSSGEGSPASAGSVASRSAMPSSGSLSSVTGAVSTAAASAANAVGDAASAVGGKVSGLADTAKAGLASATDAVGSLDEMRRDYSQSARQTANKVGSAARDLIAQEPLALAAVGLALGTAIGVMLPHTEFEDAQLGAVSGKLREKAADLVDQGVSGAKAVAAEAYQTVKDEADSQGLESDGSSIVSQVGNVVKAAAAKTEDSVRQKLQGAADDLGLSNGGDAADGDGSETSGRQT